MTRATALGAATVLFALLATANAGGYRFGVSDQAFYVPASVLAMDADAFPRDAPLIRSQARLLVTDEVMAAVANLLDVDLPSLFFAGYLITMVALFLAAVAFARSCRFSWWGVAALLLLMTFRHRIAKTGANSLEGYMHPRMLAFALGVAALAALVRGRLIWSAACVALAACVHPTTALWFAIVVFVGTAVAQPRWRPALFGAALAASAVGLWVVLAGPLSGDLVRMDPAWLGVLAGKDYLFPTDWPTYAWLANLAYPAVIGLLYRERVIRGEAVGGERALLAGLLALVAIFLISVPLTALRIALVVEFQVTRVFWVLDFVLAAYVAWWLVRSSTGRMAIVVALALASCGRGVYLLTIEHPERQLVRLQLAPGPWTDAMQWIATQPADWHVLADPDHGWKYGTSVRVAARRDTLVEVGKDTAISLYDRDIAMRVAERLQSVGVFDEMTPERLDELRTRYDLDVVIMESHRTFDLPELYRNDQFVIYDLR